MVVEAVEIGVRTGRMAPVGTLDRSPPLSSGNTTGRWKSSGKRPAKTNVHPSDSARVTRPVRSTNAANSALVTGARPMANAGTSTLRTGPSRSAGKRSSSVPIRNDPAGISTASEAGADANEPSVGDGRFVVGELGSRWGEQQGELTRPS